jgi:alpha-amylase/alpha-mannosidase (GH57 family)
MTERALCIHGHFYQPPREDPLTGEIPIEPGAAPYRNWNERIHAQCYYPNALLHNFEKISYNIGPTLLEWMFDYDPETEASIIQQDRANMEANQVGNAMAQAYNHTILPLAAKHDKITQVRWGVADFELRFGHRPLGMWLPETAADDETLEVLADCGIQYTILAPWQAEESNIDTTQPYRVILKDGKSIVVFFYDQELSTRISFDPASTVNADRFLGELVLSKYDLDVEINDRPQIIMVASDGELYGHHQPFRDKFLSYLLDGAMKSYPLEMTYPGLWLKKFPVTETLRIRQKTSWSCHHGVKRWSEVCNCTPHSEWKEPFRKALDQLAKAVDQEYLKLVNGRMADPWELRHQYIRVIHQEVNQRDLVDRLIGRHVEERELERILTMLRAQYERQRMFTSCGWFFDDFDRIEPRNNVAYAAQAVLMVKQATGADLSLIAEDGLAKVKSWRSGLRADVVFRKHLLRAAETWA